jgi:copper chaperone
VNLNAVEKLRRSKGAMSRTYTVPGISCDHCKHAIESEVSLVAGVDRVDVDVAEKTVRVEGVAGDDAVRAAIARAGYEATSHSA